MKFKITSKSNNSILVHYYDNISQEITTSEGIPVNLNKDPRCSELIVNDDYISSLGVKQKEDITHVRITLGFNCNFHCKYCLEGNYFNDYNKSKVIKIHEDLESRAEFIVNKIFKEFPNLSNILFWGGEPFVYYKLMRKLVEKIKDKNSEIQLGTITNGSLLDEEKARWLIDNKMTLSISHDGPSFKVYRDDLDPLDNPKVVSALKILFKEYNRVDKCFVHFNVVVTPENSDLNKISEYFESKLGFKPNISFEGIVKLDKNTEKIISKFTESDKKTLLNNLVAYGSTPDLNHVFSDIRNSVTKVLKSIVSKKTIRDTACMIPSKNFVAVDLNGNALVCHGNPKSYCSIEEIDKVEFPTDINKWKEIDRCKSCPFIVSCGGPCAMLDKDDINIQCDTLKIWHSGIFIAAWKLLFNSTIVKIEPVC